MRIFQSFIKSNKLFFNELIENNVMSGIYTILNKFVIFLSMLKSKVTLDYLGHKLNYFELKIRKIKND
jgi:hypothetical protein